ncbi:hypothetical protein HK107_00135 [Parvularcula sp. ZS-1/3]|uniref:Uncharacterized protein n=2 Tax=Parvularcula mediterranea TaxID=2732508 RepID=A0A7Y3RIK1_9PROT|nr:hypothetical protein [Parvularcula mediterranea]
MTGAKPFIAAALSLALACAGTAAAHRTPDAYITAERVEIGGEAVTALTIRLDAEDALRIASGSEALDADLSKDEVKARLATHLGLRLDIGEAELSYFGGEVEGDAVFVYLTGPAALEIRGARVLSSVYREWTNVVEDKRSDGPTRMFTQNGELAPGEQLIHQRHKH